MTSSATPALRNGANLVTSVWVIALRILRKYARNPQVIVFSAVQSIAFLLIFRYVFGGAIESGNLRYVDFMVPGLLTVGVLFSGMGSSVGVAQDVHEGVFDRFRSLPIPRSSVIIGRVVADTLLVAFVLAITTGVAFAVGFRVHEGWSAALAAFGLCALFGFAFIWVFVALGLLAGNPQAAGYLGFLALPLSFVSSAYVPVDTMPAWLQVFAENQPVTVMINAVRTLTQGSGAETLLGHTVEHYVLRSLMWAIALVTVFGSVAISCSQKR